VRHFHASAVDPDGTLKRQNPGRSDSDFRSIPWPVTASPRNPRVRRPRKLAVSRRLRIPRARQVRVMAWHTRRARWRAVQPSPARRRVRNSKLENRSVMNTTPEPKITLPSPPLGRGGDRRRWVRGSHQDACLGSVGLGHFRLTPHPSARLEKAPVTVHPLPRGRGLCSIDFSFCKIQYRKRIRLIQNFARLFPLATTLMSPKSWRCKDKMYERLRTVYDPESPVNIYDLGLFTRWKVEPTGCIYVKNDLTSPGLPCRRHTFPAKWRTRSW